jgi:hypothetical protein
MTGGEAIPPSEHDVLTESECAYVRDAVLALREHWTQRGEGGFFTLGAASYLDAPNQRDAYLEAARATNPVLHASFEGLLERVRLFFEEFLGEPVRFDPRYALPGFHVFVLHGSDRSQDNPARRAHFDLQWMHVFPEHVPAGTLSFTLPIEEPTGGASMALWHARYQDALDMRFTAGQYASRHPWQTLEYTRGRIVVHDGLILHAIGAARMTRPKGLRVTVQGHGLRLPAGWVLYW